MNACTLSLLAAAFILEVMPAAFAEGRTKAKADPALPNPSFDISPEEAAANQHYHQPNRPQFHYTPIQGFVGDVTGLIYDGGSYHMFYMSDKWERRKNRHKCWGYATSKDLLHWQEQPSVLDPVLDHKTGSGSGIIDWDNTLGLATGDAKTLVVFYTDYSTGSCILYSTDGGKTWIRHPRNPVLPRTGGNDRDPTVFWYAPSKEWRMIRHLEPFHGKPEGKTGFAFFKSANLVDWTYLSELGDFNECPDIFELPAEGAPPGTRKWVLMDAGFNYKIGSFDGTVFVPETAKLRADYGASKFAYAPQTWKRPHDGQAPPVQMGFLHYPKGASEMPVRLTWHGQLTFPCVLGLRACPEGLRLVRNPIPEITSLYEKTETQHDIPLNSIGNPLKDLRGDTLDIQIDIDLQDASALELVLRGEKIRYSPSKQKLEWGSIRAPLPLAGKRLQLRALVDRSSVEIFADAGHVSISRAVFFEPQEVAFSLTAEGSPALARSISVSHIKSTCPHSGPLDSRP